MQQDDHHVEDTAHAHASRALACPHCGLAVDAAALRFIAEDPDCGEDPLAGVSIPAGSALRFLPSRFDAEGFPIDPGGRSTRRPACPHCREELSLDAVAALLATMTRATAAPAEHDR
jgi:hypothetical protein